MPMSIDNVLFAAHAPGRMSTVSGSGSDDGSLSGYARRMAFPKSVVRIGLANHFSSKVYTSGSPVAGAVYITTQRDVRFDCVQVMLMGTARSRVDGFGSPSQSSHVFLKLDMPVPEALYPVPRVLEPGQTLTVPFNFVVPHHLTLGACSHRTAADLVHDHHVRLPPSLGSWERDDLAPEMARVEYAVRVRVLREPDLGARMVRILEASQPLRVLPASPEDPPLSLTTDDRNYRMAKTKTLRRKLLSARLGRLTATASQPGAARLRADGLGISSTDAQVLLHFEPSSPDLAPPRVTAVSARLTARTYFASSSITTFPNLGDWQRTLAAEKRGSYSTSVSLFSQPIDKFRWSKHTGITRRDSGYSSDTLADESDADADADAAATPHADRLSVSTLAAAASTASPRRKSDGASPDVFHTAILQVPIKLPLSRKTFVPTFHSCLLSRVYILQLAITLSSGSAGSSTINLSVPLQVAVDRDAAFDADLPSFEAAVEEAEADEHLRPRLLSVPRQQFQETSVLPGYGDSGGG